MKPIAKGRAIILGSITVDAGRGDLITHERSILVKFDSHEEFAKAVEYGAIDAPSFEPPPRGRG